MTCSLLPTSSSLGHWLPFNETGWPERSKGDTLCRTPGPGMTPDRDSSSSEGDRERKGQIEEELPVHREVFVSHHELEIVNNHVGDVVHVDCVLHGVNHCPEQRRSGSAPGISGGRDGNAEPGKGMKRKSWKVPGPDGVWAHLTSAPPTLYSRCSPIPQGKVVGIRRTQCCPHSPCLLPCNAPGSWGSSGHTGMHAGAQCLMNKRG